MPQKNAVEEYKTQRYKDYPEPPKPKCSFSTIEPSKDVDGKGHAGTKAHRCTLDKGHEELCKCQHCGYEWKGWG